jgi:hypothetical protein
MTRHRITLAFAVLVGVLATAAAVQASIPDGAGTIHGCYSKSAPPGGQPGAMRVIDTALGQTCQISEGAVNWSQTGPPGPQGPQGPQGPPGPKGDKGDPGANAYFAGTGLTLSGGNTFNIQKSFQLPQSCGLNQAPYQTAVPNTWGCFTAANAGENCSSGKFQNGVDANGDIKCGTPAGSAGPDVWSTYSDGTDTPQNGDTTIASISLPAGTFLIETSFDAADDFDGNGEVVMICTFDQGATSGGDVGLDDGHNIPTTMRTIVTLGAPTTVNATCHDYDGSDGVDGVLTTALKIGTLH